MEKNSGERSGPKILRTLCKNGIKRSKTKESIMASVTGRNFFENRVKNIFVSFIIVSSIRFPVFM